MQGVSIAASNAPSLAGTWIDGANGFPFYPLPHARLLGRAYLFENDLEQALINLHEASMRSPVDLETRVYLTAAMVAAGDRKGAEWEAEEIRALDAGFSMRRWLETYPLASAEHRNRLSGLLSKAGL